MKASQILLLVATYGPSIVPLIQSLIQIVQSGDKEVTPEELAALSALAAYSSTESLKAKGIQIVDGKVVPIA